MSADFCPAIWNVLHDGTILRIEGSLPGDIQLEIECDYLRDRFDAPGSRFFLILENCAQFIYRPWSETSIEIRDFTQLAARRLWILSADPAAGFCKVHCSEHIPQGNGGVLDVSATSFELKLDDGSRVSLKEVEDVADEYWQQLRHSSKDN